MLGFVSGRVDVFYLFYGLYRSTCSFIDLSTFESKSEGML